jgi:hypothetical protein
MLSNAVDTREEMPDSLVSSEPTKEETPNVRTSGEIVRLAYSVFRRNFRALYKLTLPPSIFVLLVYYLRLWMLYRIRESRPTFQAALIEGFAVNFGCYFLAWLLETASLAAVCSAVSMNNDTLAVSDDGYRRVRERFGAISYIAFMTYLRFIVLFAILMTLFSYAIFVVRLVPRNLISMESFGYVEAAIVFILCGAAIMGYAFAVPIVLNVEKNGREAMRSSWRLTDGYEGAIFQLIVEGLVSLFVASYAADWLGKALFRNFDLRTWGAWPQWILTAMVGAAVQIPMFIGFALLYERAVNVRSEAISVAR